jgi:hypothetical protein
MTYVIIGMKAPTFGVEKGIALILQLASIPYSGYNTPVAINLFLQSGILFLGPFDCEP